MIGALKRKAQGFFALDVQRFEAIRRRGLGIEEAAAYLCLITSTDQSNVTSSGGINSIMSYSGLARSEAKKAVQNLAEHGLVAPAVGRRYGGAWVSSCSAVLSDVHPIDASDAFPLPACRRRELHRTSRRQSRSC